MPQARDENGNIWEVDAQGNPVRLVQQASQQPPVDPSFPFQGPKAEADVQNTVLGNQGKAIDNQVEAGTAPTTIQTNQAPDGTMWKDPSRPDLGVIPIPGYDDSPKITGADRSAAIKGFTSSMELSKTIGALEERFKDGPGTTSGIYGGLDYLPLEENQRFDRAANASRGTVGEVLGFTGGQLNSAAEAEMNVGPFVPQSGDKDVTIEDSIQRLKDLQELGLKRSVAILGGIPDASGNIIPVPNDTPLNAMTIPRIIKSQGLKAAAFGSKTQGAPPPKGYQDEYDAFVARGGWSPEEYADFRASLDKKYFDDPVPNREAYINEATKFQERLGKGGTIDTTIPPTEEALDGVARFRNDIVNNPVGAFAANFADGVGMGGVSALTDGKMATLQDEQPAGALIGQMAGAIGGTALISKGAGLAASKFAPKLLGGGSKAQFGRDLATDVTYGSTYDGVVNGDPLSGAALAGVGTMGGQAVGKTLGAITGGVKLSPAVEYLKSRNIPLTTGQALGGVVKQAEDAATSIPVIGDMINARRLEGLQGLNRAAFDDTGAPIGFTPPSIGKQGARETGDAVSAAYDDATAGVYAPFDDPLLDDLESVTQRAGNLPKDRRRDLASVMDARIQPLADAGGMTGNQYQQAIRALKQTRNKPPSRFEGFEQDYKDAVTGTMGALEGSVRRSGGQRTISGLDSANASNRHFKTILDAQKRAKGGSASGENYTFTPSQLQAAGHATQNKFPGPRPFEDLADYGQEVLPNRIPDSGTGRRMMMGALGATALGGAQASDAYLETDIVNPYSGALATLALLGGTRGGQAFINKAITQRPELVQQLGNQIRRRKGLFGSAAVPIALRADD